MANTAEDFLVFAKKLKAADFAQEEITQRTIINRAYYAVFHLATDIADRLTLPLPMTAQGGSHQKLYDRFISCTRRPEPELLALKCIGYIASRTLKPFRFSADYDLNNTISMQAAAQTLANANKIFDKAAQLIGSSNILESEPSIPYSKEATPPL